MYLPYILRQPFLATLSQNQAVNRLPKGGLKLKDYIVEEVREAGAKLAEACGYNIHAFAEMLRKHQKETNWPTVSINQVKKSKQKRTEVL